MAKISKRKFHVSEYIWLAILLIVIIFVNGSPFLFGDAYGYFHTAKTLAVQGTLITPVIPEYTPYAAHGVVIRSDNMAVSVYPSGVSVLWYPFLKVASLFDQGTVNNDYFKAFIGHSFVDGFAILSASTVYTFLAIILLKDLLRSKGFSSMISYSAIAGAYISTYALSYFTQQPGYSHTYEIFAFALFLFLIEKFRAQQSRWYAIGAGFAASLLFSIRPVDVLIFIPIGIALIKYWKYIPWFFLGAAPMLAFTMYYNFISFGAAFSFGYSALGGQNFNLNQFRLGELLFSDFRGIVFLSPAVVVSIIILWKKYIKDKWTLLVYATPLIVLLLAISFWPYWWAGDSTGQRFFIVIVPVVAFGLAEIFRDYKKSGKNYLQIITLILIFYSLFIAILYRLSPTDRLVDPNSARAVYYTQQGVPPNNMASPADLVNYQISIITSSHSIGEYLTKLSSGFNQGRSLLLLALGETDPIVKIEKPSVDTFYLDLIPDISHVEKKGNLKIFFEDRLQYLLIPDVNFSVYNRIFINCTSDPCITSTNSEAVNVNEIPGTYIKISDNFKVWIESSVKVNFVNKKLPSY